VRGVRAFYEGDIARDIVDAVHGATGNPGLLSMEDLALYEAKARMPVCAPYRAWRVCGMPPPSSGGLTSLQILGILSNFDLSALDPNSATAVHLVAQASRLAYADRNAYIGDSDFVAVPMAQMLDPAYLATRAASIVEDRDMGPAVPGVFSDRAQAPPAAPAAEGASTTHFVIVDTWGDVVSMTSSIESAFGSHLMVRGFMLNNQLTDFAFRPTLDGREVANRPGPRKRPRSSMAPTIVLDDAGRFFLATGSPGGARIIPYVVKSVLGVLDWGIDIEGAIALANHTNLNGATALEAGTGLEDIAADLEAMGHEVVIRKLTSGLHGIMTTPDGLFGGADPRREGLVHGE
jgi:gamma-glutamyltranspeptidase/glutathione hydrolase